MFVYPPNLYVEVLTLNVIVLGGVDLGRWLGHEGGALMNGVSVLTKGLRAHSPLWGRENAV